MAASLGFGTYIPSGSLVHHLNAQVKVILACAFSVSVFFVHGWIGMCLIAALTACAYALAKVSVSKALGGLKPVVFVLLVTVVVHAFSFSAGVPASVPGQAVQGAPDGGVPLIGSFGISYQGLSRGLFLAVRIGLLVCFCSLLTFTTSVPRLSAALGWFLSPLRHLGVPVDDVAMVVSLALRFIPVTVAQAQQVARAQKARCAEFDSGHVFSRAMSWVAVLVPMFVGLFRRADELAMAMDARAYGGKRTALAIEDSLRAVDIFMLVAVMGVLVAICCVF